jgi:flagellin-like protein
MQMLMVDIALSHPLSDASKRRILALVEWPKIFLNLLTSVSITLLNFEERYKTMSTMTIHKRKAVSPVIATVILIAVAVALGIAVAFWASGLTSSFSKYEKLGVSTQYAVSGSACKNTPCWIINLGGQNTGSSDATINQIQINGVPYPITAGSGGDVTTTPPLTGSTDPQIYWASGTGTLTPSSLAQLSVPSGQSFSIQFVLSSSSLGSNVKTFASGQTVQVTIITAAGNNYPASIVLP